jgi:hypothetical protein
MGWAHLDVRRAMTELEGLFAGQWSTGMVPHLVFRAGSDHPYFPGPEWWDTPSAPAAWGSSKRHTANPALGSPAGPTSRSVAEHHPPEDSVAAVVDAPEGDACETAVRLLTRQLTEQRPGAATGRTEIYGDSFSGPVIDQWRQTLEPVPDREGPGPRQWLKQYGVSALLVPLPLGALVRQRVSTGTGPLARSALSLAVISSASSSSTTSSVDVISSASATSSGCRRSNSDSRTERSSSDSRRFQGRTAPSCRLADRVAAGCCGPGTSPRRAAGR